MVDCNISRDQFFLEVSLPFQISQDLCRTSHQNHNQQHPLIKMPKGKSNGFSSLETLSFCARHDSVLSLYSHCPI